MPVYIITGDKVAAHAKAPAKLAKASIVVQASEDLDSPDLATARLTAIWNALPNAAPVSKFKDRNTAIRRLWAAFQDLSSGPTRETKQAAVITLLRRPHGATLSEIVEATGWQPHSVRGLFSGTLRKKLGLSITSEKADRGRVYRIA